MIYSFGCANVHHHLSNKLSIYVSMEYVSMYLQYVICIYVSMQYTSMSHVSM